MLRTISLAALRRVAIAAQGYAARARRGTVGEVDLATFLGAKRIERSPSKAK